MTDRPTVNRRPLTVPEPAMSLEEIADELGVTKERIRQIEAKALSKLRKQLFRLGFEREDFFD